jgi:protein-disulfide isomerase
MNKMTKSLKFFVFGVLLTTANWAQAKEVVDGCIIAGSDSAPITIQEFSDFECPYCARGAEAMQEVLKNYPGKIKLVFRNMPLSFHKNALTAAKAFRAVCLQSADLANLYQQELFENQDKLASQGDIFLEQVAAKIGVDVQKMKVDMNSDEVAKSIAQDQKLAKSLKFTGTPSFLIGQEKLVGARPYEDFKKIIEKQLNQ